MTRTRLLIHVGTHKTGTTSLQAFLRLNAGRLAEQGVYVPTAGALRRRGGHHNIAFAALGDPRFKPRWGRIKDFLRECRKVLAAPKPPKVIVISAEDFSRFVEEPGKLDVFLERLAKLPVNVEFLAYFRDRVDYAMSVHGEMTRNHGLPTSLEDYVADVCDDLAFTTDKGWTFHFDYDRYRETFAREGVSTFSEGDYDAVKDGDAAEDGGLERDFCARIGAEWSPEFRTFRMNQSAPPAPEDEEARALAREILAARFEAEPPEELAKAA